VTRAPAWQRAIRDRCHHPGGTFVAFEPGEIEQSISRRFEHQVRKYPRRLAVKTRTHELTYGRLNEDANRVAHAILAARGEGEEPIALLMERDAPLIAAVLGVMKAGKFYVPLDPSFPPDRIGYLLKDSGASLIVTNRRHRPLAEALAGRGIPLLDVDALDSSLSAANPPVALTADSRSWLLYTSGSTGQPKGVLQNHRNVLHRIMSYTNAVHVCPEDRLLLLHSFGVSGGTIYAFAALLNGAALLPFSLEEEGLDGLARWLIEERITIYSSVATVFRRFARTLTGAPHFPHLRVIRVGGEPVQRRDVELYRQHFAPPCVFVNELGSTEAEVSRRYFADHENQIADALVPVGYAIEDKEVLVLDDDGHPVGFDAVGEIAIHSRYLCLGYWRPPRLDEAAFLPEPNGGPERIYRTGDLGRMRPDGCLTHLGRKDFQVKVRGHRVDLAEIEAALLDLAMVKEAVVMAREARQGDQRLVAYLVPGQSPPSVAALRRHLAATLPAYMIPAAFVLLDALPLTPNGKADRLALPEPGAARPELEHGFVSPRTPLETQLAAIWEWILEVRPVGVTDDFFELGGDSLAAVSLFLEINRMCGKDLPLATLFQAPTIERLIPLLGQDASPQPQPSLVAVQPRGSRPPFFCLHGMAGNVLFCRDLAWHLGLDQPFYALQAQGLDGRVLPFTSIEAMAAHYIAEIRRREPQGPYFLGGMSFGGRVAFEMAQQMRRQGHEVALVALFDTYGPGFRTLPWRDRYRVDFHLTQLRRLGPRAKVSYVLDRVRRADGRIDRIRWVTWEIVNKVSRMTGAPLPRPFRQVEFANAYATRRYSPRVYPGRVTLFRAREQPERYGRDPQLGWGGMAAGGLDIHDVPGDHYTMWREPHVRVLAERLRGCLG